MMIWNLFLFKELVDIYVKDIWFVGYVVFVVGKLDFEFYFSGWGNIRRVSSLNVKRVECCYKF